MGWVHGGWDSRVEMRCEGVKGVWGQGGGDEVCEGVWAREVG